MYVQNHLAIPADLRGHIQRYAGKERCQSYGWRGQGSRRAGSGRRGHIGNKEFIGTDLDHRFLVIHR